MFGLREDDLVAIKTCLQKHHDVASAILFGSRAMGNFKKGSDIDIALIGKQNTTLDEIVTMISGELNEEVSTPFMFDIIDYNAIDNADLKSHIDQYGITIYLNKSLES